MGRPGLQMWTWTLCVLVSWISLGEAAPGPQYMVAIPAVLESGAVTKFCANLMHPNESLVMTVTLMSPEAPTTLLMQKSTEDFHVCLEFQVPLVKDDEVQHVEVEVKGDTFYSKEDRKVLIKVYQPMTFVQTDKPLYLPGQTVHFRVVSLDTKMRPVSPMYNIIEIEDAHNNRIAQWLNETSDSKILQLSHDLNAEAGEGEYRITVSIGSDKKIYHNFKVEKYVLPKFEVKINAPDDVYIDQEEFTVEVCGKYPYGQPVPGDVSIKMCRPLNYYFNIDSVPLFERVGLLPVIFPPCVERKMPANARGCASAPFTMSDFKMMQKAVLDKLDITAEMEEMGTGTKLSQTASARISYVTGTLSFDDTPKIYNQGEDVNGKIKAVYYNNTPIPDMTVHLLEGERWSARLLQNLTTDSDGVANFSLSTADIKGDILLYVSSSPSIEFPPYRAPYYDTKDHTVAMIVTPSPDAKTVSSLEVKKRDDTLSCDKEEDMSIHYTIVGEAQGTADLMYLVLSRGAIMGQGSQHVEVHDVRVNEGEVSFKMPVSPDMAPEVQIVAYAVLPSGEVIAHSADFNVEKCFNHKVSVEFSPSSAVPGEEVTMHVTAQSDSLCGVSAVDQSVLIKEPGKTLDADKIFDWFPVKKATDIPYNVRDVVECLPVRAKRYVLPHPDDDEAQDAYTVFKNVGMKMATNLEIRVPTCVKYKGRKYHHDHHVRPVPMGVVYSPKELSPIETVRTFFPETWIWDLVEVGDSESQDVSVTAPDSITTWETEAYCLSSGGFGLAPRKQITVFQPFFVELSLPYSIIRGESFELKATIFNYLTSCIMVNVFAAPSLDYTLTPLSGDQYTSCLCGGERKTLSWTMEPSSLGVVEVTVTAEAEPSHTSCGNDIVVVPERGRIDVVKKSLIVKPEGTEMTKTYNSLLCPKGEALTEDVVVELPDNVIAGSTRASVSVLGDIMGRALNNLDGLLHMPDGCGEQNMALLAPDIYILQYLKNTHQLTPDIEKKATKFLASGYQRQLNYKHDNGAYSTFGEGPGNTWLTAFVLKSFNQAQSFIYIDPETIKQSTDWLISKQRKNGCFERLGNLFNNRMKGGVSDEVTLSAYVTAAFLEMQRPVDDPVVKQSLSCLRESVSDHNNTYTTALLAYVFTLAGDMETRDHLLEHLDTIAIQEGGFLHWEQSKGSSSSLSVEISSYVMLAKLSGAPTNEDLGYASRIIRWLTNQQNPYGGFSSTQDTVVALQAQSVYSSLVFNPEGSSSTVSVSSPSGNMTFDVNQDNKLLYQEQLLPNAAGNYSVEVKGSACAAVQIALRYNVPTPVLLNGVSVIIKTEANCSSERPKLTLKLKSLYYGRQSSTNMVILDIKMLSGFVPDPESLEKLKGALLVDRVEVKEDHVLVYIHELTQYIPINHRLDLVQEQPVQNLKPALVNIYDYYRPDDHDNAEYSYPCTADKKE